jgi:protein O-mannosyl-transferase
MCVWGLMTLPTVVLARVSQHDTPAFSPPAASRVLVALDSLAFYLQKLVWPVGLASDYGRSPRWLLLEGPAYYTWMIPAAVAVVAWAVRRQAPWVLGCLALFVAALFPSLGLVPFDYQRYSTVADRYAYLALLAPAAALALALARRPAPALLALAGVAAGALAVLANLQTRHWRNTDTLFARALEVNPRSLAAHTNNGFEYFKAGKVDKAMEAYAIALEANPGDLRVLFDLGNLHLHQGRPAEAVEAYRQAVGRAGHRAALRGNLGLALAQLGFENEAVTELREAIRLDPNYAQAHTNLATLLRARGDWAGARHHYQEALRVDPSIEAARKGLEEMKAAGK